MIKSALSLVLSFIFFVSVASSQVIESETLVPIGDGDKLVCVLVAVEDSFGIFTFSVLGKYIDSPFAEYEDVSFNKHLKRIRKRIRKLNRKIRKARRKNQPIDTLKARRDKLKLLLFDVRDCRNEVGKYDSGNDTPGPSNPGGGGDDPGGDDPGGGDNPGGEDPGGDDPGSFDACSVTNGTNTNSLSKIINGNVCSVGDSAVVELELRNSGGSVIGFCSGTVVDTRTVITAGHCIEGVSSIRVITGNGNYNSASLHLHPNYNDGGFSEDFDVGVVVTTANINTNTFNIISNSSSLSVGETMIIAGYGLDQNSNSGVLKAGINTISAFSTYSISLNFSGTQEANTCSGDSGGPLFLFRNGEWILAGVTSNGILQNCGNGDVSNFANLLGPSTRSFISSINSSVIN